MKKLGDLFAVYQKRLRPPQKSVELVVIKVIEKVSKIKIQPSQVEYTPSTRTICLKVPSVLSSEIKLYQDEILDNLKIELGEANVPTRII